MTKKRGIGLGKDLGDPVAIAQTVLDVSEGDPRIRDYLETGGVNLDPETQAWCAEFVNATLAQAGLPGTGSAAAQSFLKYGEPVLQPRKGDIAVFGRNREDPDYDPSLGHAGFYMGEDYPGYLDILGGNQDEAVNVTPIETDRLLGFRRPPGMPEPPEAQSLAATVPQGIAAGLYGTDLSRNLHSALDPYRPGPELPKGLGGTVTPRLDSNYEQAVNAQRLTAAYDVPNAGLPMDYIGASLMPIRRRR